MVFDPGWMIVYLAPSENGNLTTLDFRRISFESRIFRNRFTLEFWDFYLNDFGCCAILDEG